VKHFCPVAARNLTKPKTPGGFDAVRPAKNLVRNKFCHESTPAAESRHWNAPQCKIGFLRRALAIENT
jgi:hypothetical protein